MSAQLLSQSRYFMITKHQFMLVLATVLFAQMAWSEDDEIKNELVLSARPTVWHVGDQQSIWLTMRYWGEIKGENLTGKDLGGVKLVKEFHHQVRAFENGLGAGEHVIGPMHINFQGEDYESNSLAVRVIPKVDSYRGVRCFFPKSSGPLGEGVQLVVYEYRDKNSEMHLLELKESPEYEVYPHGGSSVQSEDSEGQPLSLQMNYFTIVPRKKGEITITSTSFKGMADETVDAATFTVE